MQAAPVERGGADSMIRVLYVMDRLENEPRGGAERALWNLLKCLPHDRFSCSLLTFDTEQEPAPSEYAGLEVKVLRMRRFFDYSGLRAAVELFRYVREGHFDVVHTFFETSDLWAGPIARLAGAHVWVSSRRDLGILRSRLHRFAYPMVAQKFDAVFAVSEEVRRFCIEEDTVSDDKVQTIYTGVEAPIVDPEQCAALRAEVLLSQDGPIISTLANIRPIKALDVLIDAAEVVCRSYPNATFLIGGLFMDQECLAALKQQISKLGLEQNVRLLGYVPTGQLLGISDIFCLLSNSEGFSNAILEAMACELPVVATEVGGNAEAVLDGRTGFIVQKRDVASAANAILRLISDPACRRKMGAAGRRRFEESFTREAMARAFAGAYEDLIKRRNGKREASWPS
jgi:glycosyltransferase involved in cell wall biosynthesis